MGTKRLGKGRVKGKALFIRSCHEDVILTRKSHNCAGTAFVQGDSAGGSKLIEQTLPIDPPCKLSRQSEHTEGTDSVLEAGSQQTSKIEATNPPLPPPPPVMVNYNKTLQQRLSDKYSQMCRRNFRYLLSK